MPRSRVPLALGGCAAVGFILLMCSPELLRRTGDAHTWGRVLVGGGVIFLGLGVTFLIGYVADGAVGPNGDTSFVMSGDQ